MSVQTYTTSICANVYTATPSNSAYHRLVGVVGAQEIREQPTAPLASYRDPSNKKRTTNQAGSTMGGRCRLLLRKTHVHCLPCKPTSAKTLVPVRTCRTTIELSKSENPLTRDAIMGAIDSPLGCNSKTRRYCHYFALHLIFNSDNEKGRLTPLFNIMRTCPVRKSWGRPFAI